MSKFQNLISNLNVKMKSLFATKMRLSSKITPKQNEDPNQDFIERVKKEEDIGLYLDWFTWNWFVRPVVSITAGCALTITIVLLDKILGTDLIDLWLGLAITLLMTYWVGMGESSVETVPEGRMAMITWFGVQFRIYRMTGEYSWTGKVFRLGRTAVVKEPMTDNAGFFFTDVVQVNIWNVYEADATKRTNILSALTKTGGEVKANLLLMLKMRDPMLWITKIDPMMDIGERSRMSFRTAVSFFTGKDVVSVKNLLTELMSGYVVLTSFLKEGVDTLTKHSLIRDSGGDPMYESVRPGEDVDEETEKFTNLIKSKADKKLLKHIHKDDQEKPIIERREVSESLEEVLHACGITLTRASVGFISLPEEVVKAANQADAQPYQLTTQLASAEAAKQARIKLMPTDQERNDPTFADRQAFAAASDPDSRVEVIHVSGGGSTGDPLGAQRAAAIVSNAIKEGAR